MGLAFLIGYWLVLKQAREQGISQKKIFWLAVFIFLGAILGARLGYILQFPNYYLAHPQEIFQFNAGGLTFYGGFLGALIIGWLYIRKSRLNPGQTVDILVPAIALGIFIGRLGCSLINDHQGAITNLPWAIQWPDGSLRHPVAEYLALNGLIMFLIFWQLRTRFKKSGQIFIAFLFWYALSRFLLDFFRATDTSLADPQYFGLFISQWIGLSLIIILIAWFKIKIKVP